VIKDPLDFAWPVEQAPEALEALARASGLPFRPIDRTAAVPMGSGRSQLDELSKWLESVAASAELEIEPVQSAYADAGDMIRSSAPALLRLERDDRAMLLALLAGGRRHVVVIGFSVRQSRRLGLGTPSCC
jgi:hypothetical protein